MKRSVGRHVVGRYNLPLRHQRHVCTSAAVLLKHIPSTTAPSARPPNARPALILCQIRALLCLPIH